MSGPDVPATPDGDAADEALWADLGAMWQQHDPAPDGLAERVLVALAMDDIDAEYALLHLVHRSAELVGTRGDGDAVTISFAAGDTALTVHVSPLPDGGRRLDGWVTSGRADSVVLVRRDERIRAAVDASGRFVIARVGAGPARLVLEVEADAASPRDAEPPGPVFATPVVEL